VTAPDQQQDSSDGGVPQGAAVSFWGRIWEGTWGRVRHTVWAQAAIHFYDNQMTDSAAALTYYGMMSLLPGVLVGLTVFGLIGDPSVPERAANELVKNSASPETAQVVDDVLTQMINASRGALSVALVVSILLALNGASGAFQAAGRALNRVFGWEERRSFVARRLLSLGYTLLVILLYVVTVGVMVVGDSWARDLFDNVGLGSEAADVWSIARWPFALTTAMLTVLVIYANAPSPPEEAPRTRVLSIGAVASVLLWLAAAAAFGVYVRNFSHFGAVYGVAGTLIVLLIFLYISNTAFLYGAELNAEAHRRQEAKRSSPSPSPAEASPSDQAPAGAPAAAGSRSVSSAE
jgi:membrane protein